jgi:hypothetical protein
MRLHRSHLLQQFSGSRPAAMSRSVLLVAIGILSAWRRRSLGVYGG